MSRPYLNYASVICDKIFKNLSSFYCEMHCTLLMVLVVLLCERMSPFNLLPVMFIGSPSLPQDVVTILLLCIFHETTILELMCE